MKKYIFYFSIFIITISASCKNSSYEDPSKYNTDISTLQKNVCNELYKLESIFSSNENIFNIDSCNIIFDDAITQTDEAIDKISKIGLFDSDDTYQNSAINFFSTVKELLENDYRELYELYKKPNSEWEDADYDKMYNILDGIDNKYTKVEDDFFEKQQEFIKKHNIDIY